MELQALVFDFDGLILDTETPEFTSVARVFAEFELELDRAWWQGIIGTADHPHWSELLEQQLGRALDDRKAVLERRRAHHHGLIGREEIRPGVVALLDAAAAEGVPVAIASSSPRAWVVGHLRERGLLDRFVHISTRDDVERTKPAPDLYARAVGALGVPPAAAVALEDSPHGVTAAKAAGMVAVGVPHGMTAGLDFSHADLVVGSLEQVTLADLVALVPRP